MDFKMAVKTCLTQKYCTFNGRASRSEFWFFNLAVVLIVFATSLFFPALSAIAALALFLPGLAVAVRRLHDTDRSGWWLLVACIPVIGGIILLYFYVIPGTAGHNRFGENPL